MASLRDWLRREFNWERDEEVRDINPLSFAQWLNQIASFQGNMYQLTGMGGSYGEHEQNFQDLPSYIAQLGGSSPAFTCMALRLRVFSDVRFGFREFSVGKPGKVVGDLDGRNPASRGLKLLQTPEPGLTTGDLLARMSLDNDWTGNAYVLRRNDRLVRLRPDWVTMIIRAPNRPKSGPWDIDSELIGYLYLEGGPGSGNEPIRLLPEEVAHWAPTPDPLARRRGQSWVMAVVREILADSAAVTHEGKFFENDATVNQQLVFEKGTSKEIFEYAKDAFKESHEGIGNAYKTLFVLGAKLEKIGTDFKDMDFTALQGRFETRIAAASGIGPVLAQFSEGLQGSALNAGNYQAVRRMVADTMFRPLWRNLCGSLEHIIETPAGKELWYFETDTPFLQEDQKDAAQILQTATVAMENLIRSGWEAESILEFVAASTGLDASMLKHTGLFSIQLQAPGSTKMPQGEAPGELPVGPGPAIPEKPAINPAANPQGNGKTPAGSLPAGKP